MFTFWELLTKPSCVLMKPHVGLPQLQETETLSATYIQKTERKV